MRIYTIQFSGVSVSAVQDLISAQSTSGGSFYVNEIYLGQITQTSVEILRVSVKRFSGAYSIGSAGTSATPQKMLFGDAAATATGRVNDTTQTTSGTAVTLATDDFNLINGWQYLPAPEDRIKVNPSQAIVLSLDTAPASARTMSGYMVIAEDF